MISGKATAFASPNIAFIKYWGNSDNVQRIPANGSISMTLSGLETKTTLTFDPALACDSLRLNDVPAEMGALERVSAYLTFLRDYFKLTDFCTIESWNNFPSGTGIASSASAFAALAGAYARAAKLDVSEQMLSILARHGSGSASRSIYGGFVEWKTGVSSSDSYSEQIASPSHWNLVDEIAVIGYAHKEVGSSQGHYSANTSPIQETRVLRSSERLDLCRIAVLNRDFEKLAYISELDSNLLHAVMMTSNPSLLYWEPGTIRIMRALQNWRREGIPVFYTIDAGPNVHCITTEDSRDSVRQRILELPDIMEVITATPGDGIRYS